MTVKQSNWYILLALAALLIASLACNLPGLASQETGNRTPIPVSTDAVGQLERELRGAAETATATGRVSVVITEEQLTSLVALQLQNQPDAPLINPQVRLRDGQVQLTGDYQQSGLSVPLTANMVFSADADGRLRYQVVSGELGPFALPQEQLNQLSGYIDAVLQNELGPELENMFIEELTVADGQMTINGRTR